MSGLGLVLELKGTDAMLEHVWENEESVFSRVGHAKYLDCIAPVVPDAVDLHEGVAFALFVVVELVFVDTLAECEVAVSDVLCVVVVQRASSDVFVQLPFDVPAATIIRGPVRREVNVGQFDDDLHSLLLEYILKPLPFLFHGRITFCDLFLRRLNAGVLEGLIDIAQPPALGGSCFLTRVLVVWIVRHEDFRLDPLTQRVRLGLWDRGIIGIVPIVVVCIILVAAFVLLIFSGGSIMILVCSLTTTRPRLLDASITKVILDTMCCQELRGQQCLGP